jgi:hypothetical protein
MPANNISRPPVKSALAFSILDCLSLSLNRLQQKLSLLIV